MRAFVALLALLTACAALHAEEPATAQVLFVCEHGNVKSLMAASYFNRLAAERGLRVRAISRGVAPDELTAPAAIVASLQADGFDVRNFRPMAVSLADVAAAERIITIGAALPTGIDAPAETTERWDDVPAASVDYAATRDSLEAHIEQFLEWFARFTR